MTDKERIREIKENIKYMKNAKSLQEAGIGMEEAMNDFKFLLKRIRTLEKHLRDANRGAKTNSGALRYAVKEINELKGE